jgi:hypothetical protein
LKQSQTPRQGSASVDAASIAHTGSDRSIFLPTNKGFTKSLSTLSQIFAGAYLANKPTLLLCIDLENEKRQIERYAAATW